MNKKQAAEQISTLFQSKFDRENYTHFLRNLLNDVESRDNHYSGNTVSDAFKQHINQYWRIGKYIDPEEVEMDLYVVEVKSLSKLDRARTALRNFAVRSMQTFGDKDHALIAFYAKEDNGADWRFSYVKIEHTAKLDEKHGKVNLEKEFTPAKRYSFLVGKHERSHTAQAQLVDLLAMDYANPTVEEIEKAFSIEKVTKEFFEQYKGLFVRLSEVLPEQAYFQRETDEEKRKQIVAKFAKKLLGQIVFLYFLQKKGWLGVKDGDDWGKGERCFLRKLFEDANQDDQNYYVEKLQYLFYEALASDRKDQSDPSYYKKFDCKIPFLNGGLFEADYDWQKIRVEIPDTIFSNGEKTKVGDKGTGILDVFDRYNFTIKEDEPLEKEVAVDPEMLGKVFENMLEITERKSKGAFYTPREIVHYMCQESLIHYLNGEVGDNTATAIPKAAIETLVRKGIFAIENDQRILEKGKETDAYTFKMPVSIRTHAELIDDKLANIKICDPAIGSGAFPVGMLHEILHARQALSPHLPEAKRLRPYDLKKHTIGHSIYGVDLDPSAIDIARLRLWLSLVVDEDDYRSIDALPNLDYKIMQGNSLVEEYEGVKLFDEAFIQDEDKYLEREKAELVQKQLTAQTNFFAAHFDGHKELEAKYETELDHLGKAIQKVENKKKRLAKEKSAKAADLFDMINEARRKAKQLEELHQRYFNVSSPKEKRDLRNEITRIEWELIEATLIEQKKTGSLAKLAEYKTSGEKPWFLWKLNFSDVFKQKGGFDIVIGNPPYVQIQSLSNQQIQKDLESQKYETFSKTGDIYCLFYERGYRILRDNAALCFITSNKWMRAKYGEKTRKFFECKTAIQQLIDFGDSPIFSEATTYTNIILFEKCNTNVPLDKNHNRDGCVNMHVWDMTNCYQKHTSLTLMLEQQGECSASFDSSSYVIVNPQMARIKKRIDEVGTPLKNWEASIYRGILTGFNEAFIIDGKKKDELIFADSKSAEIIKPILRGRDIKRYHADIADLWLITTFPALKLNIDDYPAVKSYLESFGRKLYQTGEVIGLSETGQKVKSRKKTRNKWFETQDQIAYFSEFKKEKIIYAEIVFDSAFYLDDSGIYPEATSFILTGEHLKYITALLNSRLLTFAFKAFYAGGDLRGDTFRYKKAFLHRLPVIRPADEIMSVLELIVDYIQILKREGQTLPASYYEQLIDGLVFELYFPEKLKKVGKDILQHLGNQVPLTKDMSEERRLAVILSEFERLYDPNHPVRNNLETLDSVEEVRIIRDALKSKS